MARRNKQQRRVRADIATGAPQPQLQLLGRYEAQVCGCSRGVPGEHQVTPAVLFARRDSVYKTLDCDVWDEDRNALLWPGGAPVVAHPPCRLWGSLRTFARSSNPAAERHLAIWAVLQIRSYGGVLEHPKGSTLWPAAALPFPGHTDPHGGYTLAIPQFWFGHKAQKNTWFYICKVPPAQLPPVPLVLGHAGFVIATKARGTARRPEVTKPEREQTPLQLATWLLEVARRVGQ